MRAYSSAQPPTHTRPPAAAASARRRHRGHRHRGHRPTPRSSPQPHSLSSRRCVRSVVSQHGPRAGVSPTASSSRAASVRASGAPLATARAAADRCPCSRGQEEPMRIGATFATARGRCTPSSTCSTSRAPASSSARAGRPTRRSPRDSREEAERRPRGDRDETSSPPHHPARTGPAARRTRALLSPPPSPPPPRVRRLPPTSAARLATPSRSSWRDATLARWPRTARPPPHSRHRALHRKHPPHLPPQARSSAPSTAATAQRRHAATRWRAAPTARDTCRRRSQSRPCRCRSIPLPQPVSTPAGEAFLGMEAGAEDGDPDNLIQHFWPRPF